MPLYLIVTVTVKYRFAGITLGTSHSYASFPIPPIITTLAPLADHLDIGSYHDHGVDITASLSPTRN